MTNKFYLTDLSVTCRFDIEGMHNFADVETALGLKDNHETIRDMLEDVSFLKYPHRHRFYFTFTCEVDHDNRDVEFIRLGRLLKMQMLAKYPIQPNMFGCANFGGKSCEMLAQEVIDIFVDLYPNYIGSVKCTVSEDNENDGSVGGYVGEDC